VAVAVDMFEPANELPLPLPAVAELPEAVPVPPVPTVTVNVCPSCDIVFPVTYPPAPPPPPLRLPPPPPPATIRYSTSYKSTVGLVYVIPPSIVIPGPILKTTV
jgi:hypothetical protein